MVAVREGHAFRVFPPMVFETKSSNRSPLVKMSIGQEETSEYALTVLRGVNGVMQTLLERSNYSACIYFEKHAGPIIYSAVRHFLE